MYSDGDAGVPGPADGLAAECHEEAIFCRNFIFHRRSECFSLLSVLIKKFINLHAHNCSTYYIIMIYHLDLLESVFICYYRYIFIHQAWTAVVVAEKKIERKAKNL